MMKKNIMMTCAVGSLLLATSCVELDQLPQSFLTEEEYIETPQTLDVVAKAVSGVYKDMWNGNYGFSCRILRYSTAAGDIVPLVTKPNNDMLYLYNMTPTTSGSVKDVTALWKNFWDVISSSNKIIGGTPIPEDQAEAAKYKAVVAEARFMRALAYFHLVRMFGDVPFIASSGETFEDKLPRVPVARIYDEIIVPDLTIACTDLPATSRTGDAGSPSQWAAKTCLADVNLTMAGWPLKRDTYAEAARLAKDVIEKSGLTLTQKYGDLWKEAKKHDANEHLFAIMNSVAYKTPSQYGKSFYPNTHAKYPGWGDYFANPKFVESCPDDDRKAWNFELAWDEKVGGKVKHVTYQESANKLPLISKYRDYNEVNKKGVLSQLSNGLTTVYRLADTYLIYAEASTLATKKVDDLAARCLRRLQERANVPEAERTQTTDPEAFDKAVFKERGIELYAEGKRWFDYIRREKAAEIKELRYVDEVSGITDPFAKSVYKKEGHYYLPIPQDEVQMAGWENNKGY
ncbi:RagB/SusD family nutrient uptake outer membrane protein [Bacteroides pyogenes]|uniref:RagB/SusD family nutrient uptake outer membrane protein n=1 Tax=Bacteroides pyogenes TaxID=310300 RepID=UPI001F2FDDE4|nr:RagB/SusD family nutrient uptake outer membrane protein [Bacteroides pyogenes]